MDAEIPSPRDGHIASAPSGTAALAYRAVARLFGHIILR